MRFVILLVLATALVARAAEPTSPSRSDFEHAVDKGLACTCGSCKLEAIDHCACKLAANMRDEVHAALNERDLSTEAARNAALAAVRASFVARYGDDVLHPVVYSDAAERIPWLGPAMFLVGLAVVVLVGARSIRRGRRRQRAHMP